MTIGVVPTQMASQAAVDPLEIVVPNNDVRYRVGLNETGGWTWLVGTAGLRLAGSGELVASTNTQAGHAQIDIPLSPYQIALVASAKDWKIQPVIDTYCYATQTDEGGLHILFLDSSGNVIGGESKGIVLYSSLTWDPLWVPPGTEAIRIDFLGLRLEATENSVYLNTVSLYMEQDATNEAHYFYVNQDDAVAGTFTQSEGAAMWVPKYDWGLVDYPGVGAGEDVLSTIYTDVLVSSLPAQAQAEIAAGNANLLVKHYAFNDNSDDQYQAYVACRDSSSELSTVGETSWIDPNKRGASGDDAGAVPATTDRFRIYYRGNLIDGSIIDVAVSNYFALVVYPKA